MGRHPKSHSTELVPTESKDIIEKRFADLSDVPTEIEWLANFTNPLTRRAYRNDARISASL